MSSGNFCGDFKMDKKHIAVITVATVLSLLAVVFGYFGYPVSGTNDAIYFMPPAVTFALHHEFTNPVTKRFTNLSDPTGQERFLLYPPLFPMIVSLFISPHIPLSYPRQAFLALGLINMISLALASWVFYKVATMRDKRLNWLAVMLIILVSIITLRVLWGSGGRPETLARLFVTAGLFGMLYLKERKLLIGTLALLLGLMAATHPGGTLLFAAAIGIFFSLEDKWRGVLRDTAITCALGGLVFLLLIQLFSPFNVFEVLSGTALNAGTHTQVFTGVWSGTHLMQVIASDFSSPYKTLLFLMMVIMLIFGVKVYREHRSKIKSPFLFVFFCVIFAGLIVYFVTESRNGYVMIFSTPIFAALLYGVIHIFNTRAAQYGTVAILLLLTAVAARPIALFPSFIKDGVGIDAARNAFAKISSEHPGATYVVTFQMWTISENYKTMETMGDFGPTDIFPPHAMVIWGQTQDNYNAATPPPDIRGCPIIASNFVAKVPKIFGIRLADTTPSYAFAAYECP